MTNEHMPDFLKILSSKSKMELSDDELEKVSGGVMTDNEKKLLMFALIEGKRKGLSKDDIMDMVEQYFPQYSPQFPNVEKKDVTDYIKENWDKIIV